MRGSFACVGQAVVAAAPPALCSVILAGGGRSLGRAPGAAPPAAPFRSAAVAGGGVAVLRPPRSMAAALPCRASAVAAPAAWIAWGVVPRAPCCSLSPLRLASPVPRRRLSGRKCPSVRRRVPARLRPALPPRSLFSVRPVFSLRVPWMPHPRQGSSRAIGRSGVLHGARIDRAQSGTPTAMPGHSKSGHPERCPPSHGSQRKKEKGSTRILPRVAPAVKMVVR